MKVNRESAIVAITPESPLESSLTMNASIKSLCDEYGVKTGETLVIQATDWNTKQEFRRLSETSFS